MTKELLTPDYIFESSWEVCNKVGGIYTVLSTRANTLQARFHDRLFSQDLIFGRGKRTLCLSSPITFVQHGKSMHLQKITFPSAQGAGTFRAIRSLYWLISNRFSRRRMKFIQKCANISYKAGKRASIGCLAPVPILIPETSGPEGTFCVARRVHASA